MTEVPEARAEPRLPEAGTSTEAEATVEVSNVTLGFRFG